MAKENVIFLNKGLWLDNHAENQPEGTYTYALNATDEDILGQNGFSFMERSNTGDAVLSLDNKVLIGTKNISSEEACLILTDGKGKDEIGIFNRSLKTYTAHLKENLGLKETHQIDIQYRVRLGCEKTIYFTDNLNVVRYYNFSRPELFLDADGIFDSSKLSLVNDEMTVPSFAKIETTNTGNLPPGKVFIGLQYVDDDMNSTDIIVTSQEVKIYNDSTNNNYFDIEGSTGEVTEYYKFPKTNKAIAITLTNLDRSYSFYRLVFMNYSSGTGELTNITFSSNISTSNPNFIYSGDNVIGKMSIEEFQTEYPFYPIAKNILQIDDGLLLSNLKGPQINYCKLQKYASKIKANLVIKEVTLNNINDRFSPKNPLGEYWLMPGEIYSYGLILLFKGNKKSPVFHIPGRSEKDKDITNRMGVDNTCMSSKYTSSKRSLCDGESNSWGADYLGDKLIGKNIRHHRLPSRADLGLKNIYKTTTGAGTIKDLYVKFSLPAFKPEYKNTTSFLKVKINYLNNNDLNIVSEEVVTIRVPLIINTEQQVFVTTLYDYQDLDSIEITEVPDVEYGLLGLTFPTLKYLIKNNESLSSDTRFYIHAFGIEFSNIEMPTLEECNGMEIIGYEIVRNDRKISDRTIFDTGILTPGMNSKAYTSVGVLNVNYGFYPAGGATIPVQYNTNSALFKKIANGGGTAVNSNLSSLEYKLEQVVTRINWLNQILSSPNLPILQRVSYTAEKNKLQIERTQLEEEITNHSNSNADINTYNTGGGTAILKGNVFGLITPEHKFNNQEYSGVSEIAIEGFYYQAKTDSLKTDENIIQDAQDGTSYDPEVHKKKGFDTDGFDLKIKTRINTEVDYTAMISPQIITTAEISEVFYLDALFSKTSRTSGEKEIFNILCDNKMGVLTLNTSIDPGFVYKKFPYVTLKRYISEPYSGFEYLPYYVQTHGKRSAKPGQEKLKIEVYSGDVTMTSIALTSSIFIDIAIARRATKSGTCSIIIGIVISVGAVVGAFFTAGASLAALGAGLSMVSSGIKQDRAILVYQSLWSKGLRDTVIDEDSKYYSANYRTDDDEIRWLIDNSGQIFFESPVNMDLRYKSNIGLPSYIGPNVTRNELKEHAVDKLTTLDPDKGSSRGYRGFAMSENYFLNKDYSVKNEGKLYYHLPPSYDCCSECMEEFPHRIIYSEKSFNEELTDNYKKFLPNNFKDMPSDTGEINNMFYQNGDLYIHTRDAIYKQARSTREIVKDNIVTFIGSGNFFELPAIKLLEGTSGNSAGITYKFSGTQYPGGYFFMSTEGVPYTIESAKLKDLSMLGLNKFFKGDTIVNKNLTQDNPASKKGVGYISTFDPKLLRLILTKVDRGNSWTLAFSLKNNKWLSFMSYTPNNYLTVGNDFYSYDIYQGGGRLWKHASTNSNLRFYGEVHSHELELTFPTRTGELGESSILEGVIFKTDYLKYNSTAEQYFKEPNKTFNKMLVFNSYQSTGIMNLILKNADVQKKNLLLSRVKNVDTETPKVSLIDNRYAFNAIRDNRIDYNIPIFVGNKTEKIVFTNSNKYIKDVKVNTDNISKDKSWKEKQVLRDTSVSIRFIYDLKDEDCNILTGYISPDLNNSKR